MDTQEKKDFDTAMDIKLNGKNNRLDPKTIGDRTACADPSCPEAPINPTSISSEGMPILLKKISLFKN